VEDSRIWPFEESLWTGDADHYRYLVDDECVMVLPTDPHVFAGRDAIEAVASTPRWSSVELSERQVMRPQEGLIVIAYRARATGAGEHQKAYDAFCTSTYRRLAHDEWRVVQHSQLPPLTQTAETR
jgi:hypothetical protein